MADRRWTMQRGSVGVWQRLPYGPAADGRGRPQARRAPRRGPRLTTTRPLADAVMVTGALVALAAGWGGV